MDADREKDRLWLRSFFRASFSRDLASGIEFGWFSKQVLQAVLRAADEIKTKHHMEETMKFRSWSVALITIVVLAGMLPVFASRSVVRAQNPSYKPETEHVIPSLDGPTLYVTYCAVCHGKAADGQGPMAPVLKVRVPDLTEIAKRNGGIFPFVRVQKIIDGTDTAGLGHGTREMPIWGPIFSQVTDDRDYGKVRIHNLAKYLESIQK
ncbi:MAG TPA: c-type cytochrome [Acidobacteriaceae bacterium]|nr:c-type cytochrome [Acidobacteriaceae bacterium]